MKFSTEQLYGVEPTHFDEMTHFDALAEKVRLAEKKRAYIVSRTSDMNYGSELYEKMYEIYTTVNKAKIHNLDLIEERKKYGNKSSKREKEPLQNKWLENSSGFCKRSIKRIFGGA